MASAWWRPRDLWADLHIARAECESSSAAQRGPAKAERRVLYWVDPMHPAYKSDKPGIAPDCGMKLEPVYEDARSPANRTKGN